MRLMERRVSHLQRQKVDFNFCGWGHPPLHRGAFLLGTYLAGM
jgi:hypothetical protein